MLLYLFIYIISLYLTDKACRYNNLLFHFAAVILPVLLLTFRSVSVGTDTHHYIDIFDRSCYALSLSDLIITTRFEIGFLSITYLISKIGLSVKYAFLVYALLTILPIYIGSYLYRKQANPIFIMGLFYLMFYHYSFNIVRQSIAMSFVFLSAIYLLKDRVKVSVLLWIIAILFHNTAILFIGLIAINKFSDRKNIKYLLPSMGLLFVVFYFVQSYYLFAFDYYEDSYLSKGHSTSQSSYVVEMFLNVLIALYARIYRIKNSSFFLITTIFTFLFILASPLAPFLFRIANFYDVLLLIYVPYIFRHLGNTTEFRLRLHRKNKYGLAREFSVKQVRPSKLSYELAYSYLCFALFYWWFVFIYNNSGESYPYISIGFDQI